MPNNIYFGPQTRNEQNLLEDIIVESLKAYGQRFLYIPRTLISKDEIMGEDRLSRFENAYPIEMYIENVEGFEGSGALISKFGLTMEQIATLVVSRRRWEQMVGRYDTTILQRPAEGDLIYFPLTDGLFEIKFVQHQNPFYQLGKLYVYKLQVELFQYSSEYIDTCNPCVDSFETNKTHDTDPCRAPAGIIAVEVQEGGSGYTEATAVIQSNGGIYGEIELVVEDGSVVDAIIVNSGINYLTIDTIDVVGDGTGAKVVITEVMTDTDMPQSYGDNNKFINVGDEIVFNESNPFGDL